MENEELLKKLRLYEKCYHELSEDYRKLAQKVNMMEYMLEKNSQQTLRLTDKVADIDRFLDEAFSDENEN